MLFDCLMALYYCVDTARYVRIDVLVTCRLTCSSAYCYHIVSLTECTRKYLAFRQCASCLAVCLCCFATFLMSPWLNRRVDSLSESRRAANLTHTYTHIRLPIHAVPLHLRVFHDFTLMCCAFSFVSLIVSVLSSSQHTVIPSKTARSLDSFWIIPSAVCLAVAGDWCMVAILAASVDLDLPVHFHWSVFVIGPALSSLLSVAAFWLARKTVTVSASMATKHSPAEDDCLNSNKKHQKKPARDVIAWKAILHPLMFVWYVV